MPNSVKDAREEQFIKRWVRTINEAPEAIRRMQLLYGGLKSSGMVVEDPESGEQVFVMPGSAALTGVLASVSSLVFGNEARVPVAMPLTGQLRYTTPGLDTLGVPTVGPTAAIPLGMIADRFPEFKPLQDVESFLTGDRGTGRPIWHQIIPSSVRRFAEATVLWDPDMRRHTHHMARAIAYMDMIGETPDENASAVEQQQYIERVTNWARNLALTEAIYGFIAPAAPSAGSIITDDNPFDPATLLGLHADELNQIPRPRFLEYLNEGYDWDEAVLAFLEEAPENLDYTAWTVSETQNVSGRHLPTGDKTYDWMLENRELLSKFGRAASWLIPFEEREDSHDWKAYNEQLAIGLRRRKDIMEFYEDVHIQAAAPRYEEMRDEHNRTMDQIDQMPEGEQRTRARLAEQDRWRSWSQSFNRMHPIFAEQWSSGEGRHRRQQTLAQWGEMREDPTFQGSELFHQLDGLWQLFSTYMAARSQLVGRRGDIVDAYRKGLEERAEVAMEQYIRRIPNAEEFYRAVIRPEAF